MIEILTGLGLAMSAGLNAYVPALALGLLQRYTSVVDLPGQWAWLGNGWVLSVLAVLFTVEVVADKIPALDHINDLVQTLVRPVSGGVVFTSGVTSATAGDADPGAAFTAGSLAPFLIGLLVALGIHLAKATIRSVVNLSTAGIGAPVLSTVEDVSAISMSVLAILLPILVLVFVGLAVALVVWIIRRRRARARRAAAA